MSKRRDRSLRFPPDALGFALRPAQVSLARRWIGDARGFGLDHGVGAASWLAGLLVAAKGTEDPCMGAVDLLGADPGLVKVRCVCDGVVGLLQRLCQVPLRDERQPQLHPRLDIEHAQLAAPRKLIGLASAADILRQVLRRPLQPG